MVKCKGRLGFKQYMPMKPVERGIKVWVRADATNGFVCAIQVYMGKEGRQPEHGLGHRIVSDLVHVLHGKNYHIFWDNFFTSVRLAEDLLRNNLYLCGTTRSNRTDFPANLKPHKAEVKALRATVNRELEKAKQKAARAEDKLINAMELEKTYQEQTQMLFDIMNTGNFLDSVLKMESPTKNRKYQKVHLFYAA